MPETTHNVQLTSSEISQLWSGYMGDSMAICILRYFLNRCEDTEVQSVLRFALELSEKHIQVLETMFNDENFPIPKGFGDEDVDLNAKRLFSDAFYLSYLKNTAKQGLMLYGMALSVSARADARDYFTACIAQTTQLYNLSAEVMLSKGLYVRAPYIPFPEKAEFVQKESFLNGFFGDQRPLSSLEITHLYNNIQTNALGKALISGFAQTARSKDVVQYFLKGKELAYKQVASFSEFLTREDLPAPMTWDSDVLDTTGPPFSDKLMMFHIAGLTTAGMLNYGAAIAVAMRRDVAAEYMKESAAILRYAEEGAKLMIDNEWLEKVPGNVDRRSLAKQH